jgi:methionyl-tRNA formyltransferase
MKVLHLGPQDAHYQLIAALPDEDLAMCRDPLDPQDSRLDEAEFIVSYRYRHRIPKAVIDRFHYRIINVHCGLTWVCRGVRPTFFSLLHDLPMGVTIHEVDEGWDTGPILNWCGDFRPSWNEDTLEGAWQNHNNTALRFLARHWNRLRHGEYLPSPLRGRAGPLFTMSDFDKVWPLLPRGWKTTVAELRKIGETL